jgi:16S rRNA (cytosine1402-N4)-methyltransferase
MVDEVLDLLITDRNGTYIDCTLGSAGHAQALLEALSPSGRLLGLDADAASLRAAEDRLKDFIGRASLFHASYVEMERVIAQAGVEAVDGVLLDLGLSSLQLADESRGFAHSVDAPLDMRFDASRGETAAELLNSATRKRLLSLFKEFGEVRRPGAVCGAIERARSARTLETTTDLVNALEGVLLKGPKRQRQLGQVFQAIRIAVNGEMESLDRGLIAAGRCLKPGGVLSVISYHSIEDRKVKRFIKDDREGWTALTKKPLTPSQAEVASNPRSRSAKLRAAVSTGARAAKGDEDN